VDPPALLSIGKLARLSGLTAKALRHYDRVGLLNPARVDGDTGFRFYAADQVVLARRIARLRSVDLPLDEVRAYLAAADPEAALRILQNHRSRLESRTARLTGDLHELSHLINEGVDLPMTESPAAEELLSRDGERRLAATLFNATWTLMEKEDRTPADNDRMIHSAHASRYHWEQVGTAANLARGEWQCSRVYAVLRRPEPCLHHAQRVLDICRENGIGDWDLAFGYEALARGSAVAGDAEAARMWTERALAAAEDIADEQDRVLLIGDLETIPDQPRFW
jgi:DNA-binding transcriptional MerR regulator